MTGTVQSCSLPGDPASVAHARRWLRGALSSCLLPDIVEAAELVLSELVTNAVLHAGSGVEVLVEPEDDGLRLEVRDDSPAVPTQRSYGEMATTGRGLGLVAVLAAEHGVERTSSGKAVWAVLRPNDHGTEDDVDALLDAWAVDVEEAPAGAGAAPAAVLQRFPVLLWTVAQQHHEALLRELRLRHASDPERTAVLEAAVAGHAALVDAARRALEGALEAGAPVVPLPTGHPSPLPAVPAALDVPVPAVPPGAAAALQDVLDEGERLAAAEELLALPALPELVDLRDWACEQVVAQERGVPPIPWGGAAREEFLDTGAERFTVASAAFDPEPVRTSHRWVVAGDDHNRVIAVSRPAAEGLGWRPEELEGRRIVTLVPPDLREAHVAGFSRHLVTGEAHVLGVPLVLPVQHRDGHQVACRFLVERAPSAGPRAVYLVWLEPL